MLVTMLEKWRQGTMVVWGTREQRDDPWSAKAFSWLYSTLMQKLALSEMPRTGLDLCLIDRKVVQAVVEMREKNTSIFGLILWSGFPQVFVPYYRESRKRGKSRWTLGKKIKLLVDSFVAFSFAPIRMVSYAGICLSLLGFLYGAFILMRGLLGLTQVEGWATLVTLVVFLSGVQLLMLGIVAEYLWRTFDETRRRPPYVVRDEIGWK
jgi:dolichol-phosphate mannosyltransferase